MLEFHADPAREMRIAKRIAYAVVLVFVVTVLPLYVLVFRLSPAELGLALGVQDATPPRLSALAGIPARRHPPVRPCLRGGRNPPIAAAPPGGGRRGLAQGGRPGAGARRRSRHAAGLARLRPPHHPPPPLDEGRRRPRARADEADDGGRPLVRRRLPARSRRLRPAALPGPPARPPGSGDHRRQ